LRADGCGGRGVGSRGKSTRALYPGEVARLARKICAPFWDGNCRIGWMTLTPNISESLMRARLQAHPEVEGGS